MRSYIFTDVERGLIEDFLATGKKGKWFEVLVYRVRRCERLVADINLFIKFREAISTVSA